MDLKRDNTAKLLHSWNTEWVLLARKGDRAAFDQLVVHYRPVLLALTFLRTRDVCAAEDLVQQIFIQAWQKLLRVTTVEGRICRAKRQMQHMLRNEGAAFLNSRLGNQTPDTAEEDRNDRHAN